MPKDATNPENLPLYLEPEFVPPQKWEIAAQILGFNGYRRGMTKNGAVGVAAKAIGVHRNTIFLWLRDERFLEMIEEQSAKMVALAHQGLIKLMGESVTACLGTLQNLRPDKWDSRIRLEKVKAKFQAELTKEMLERAPDLPTPVYQDSTDLPDPDGDTRPNGYENFKRVDKPL